MSDIHDAPGRAREKIRFLRGYLEFCAMDQKRFADVVRRVTKWQTKRHVRKGLGFWFFQNDPGVFGAGTSRHFHGTEASLFCDDIKDIEFASVCGVMPFDCIVVRNRNGMKWTKRALAIVVSRIRYDLAWDDYKTQISASISHDLARLQLLSPDYGFKGDGEPSLARNLQAFRLASFICRTDGSADINLAELRKELEQEAQEKRSGALAISRPRATRSKKLTKR
jgi:hypothetical protein